MDIKVYNKIIRLFFLFFTITTIPLVINAQDNNRIKKDVQIFINTSDITSITKYFDGYVELNIPGFKGIVNNLKAQNVLKVFFTKEKSNNYIFKKDGYTGHSYYIIGNYKTDKKNRIIYFLFTKVKSNYIIQKLEIE